MSGAETIDRCTRERIDDDSELATAVVSLVRYGSFERGDFVPGRSDLDYFAVVERNGDVTDRLETVLAACADPVDHRGIDLAWEFREEFGDLEAGVRFKFLTVYQRDFRRHHTLVYGEDLLGELPQVSFETALPARLDRIERLARDHPSDPEAIRMLAGETARLRARVDGADSLRKEDVLAALGRHDRTEALRVYEAYVHGDQESLPPERLRSFVQSAVARLRAERADGETS